MEIVILDGYTSNPGDLEWDVITSQGNTTIWPRTSDEELFLRAKNADILVVNKRELRKNDLKKLPKVKCICTLATGYNNVDVEYCRNNDIIVSNAVGYSSPSVAQHVFAMILHHYNNIHNYTIDVDNKKWSNSIDWTYNSYFLGELLDKVIGIYGYGKIGKKVGEIARAFGMKVKVIIRGKQKDIDQDVTYVSEKDFFESSDIISLHAPLSTVNTGYLNESKFNLMKTSAIIINTARGGLIIENDLKEALENNDIAAAYLDVLSEEPPSENHILLGVKNCFITPHIAWATQESRQRLIEIVGDNITAFIGGKPQNVVWK